MEGARQVECTINGIGERAGNASLEEIVMAFRTRADVLRRHAPASSTERLYPTSRLVSQVTGLHVQRNKAIVGQNAFAHEAGIHQHGMLTHRETYEIMRPEEVGFAKSQLVLGKHSGRHALKERLVALGYQLDDAQLDKVFADFKVLADKKKDIYDADIEALVVHGQILGKGQAWPGSSRRSPPPPAPARMPCASIALRAADGERVQEVAAGRRPGRRGLQGHREDHRHQVKLRDYQIASVSTGEDAQGEVSIEVEHRDRRLPRPRALHRHHRGHRPRLPRRHEPHRAQGRAAEGERGARRDGDAVTMTRSGLADALREGLGRARRAAETPDTPAVLYVDLHLMHEVTSPQAFSLLRERGPQGPPPGPHARHDRPLDADAPAPARRPLAVLRRAERGAGRARSRRTRRTSGSSCTGSATPQQGVVHVFGPEMGATQPGMTVVCGDSHTATHGAFGALAFGIGTSEVGHVLATQCLLQRKPRSLADPGGRERSSRASRRRT